MIGTLCSAQVCEGESRLPLAPFAEAACAESSWGIAESMSHIQASHWVEHKVKCIFSCCPPFFSYGGHKSNLLFTVGFLDHQIGSFAQQQTNVPELRSMGGGERSLPQPAVLT